MEEIKTFVTQPITKYKTVDGKVFDNERDAQRHEIELWWKKNVKMFDYGGYGYYIHTVLDEEDCKQFFRALKQQLTSDFVYRDYPYGTNVIAWWSYNMDSRNDTITCTLEEFLNQEREELNERMDELKQIEIKYKGFIQHDA